MAHADYVNALSTSRPEMLEQLVESYVALADTTNWVANLANLLLLLWHGYLSVGVSVNWAGFYVMNKGLLVLGPFQGKVACQTIEVGKGVCGAAIAQEKTQVVPDVHEFPGHIACDGETNSEIVVPIVKNGAKIGVLDIDCLQKNGFSDEDKKWLELLVEKVVATCEF